MATAFYSTNSSTIPRGIRTSCEFVQTLMKLQRAAQLITSTLDLDPLLERIVNDLAASIGSVEVSVWLRDPLAHEMVLHGVRGCTRYGKGTRLKIGVEGMVGHVGATGLMHYARDIRVDPYYIPCEPETLSAVGLPLNENGEVIGVLCVDHNQANAFSDDQLQILQALAGHTAVAIANARLFKHERMVRERIQREEQEARSVQQTLFPKSIPLIPGFTFQTAWEPAGAVAGDWFDFIDLGNNRVGIVLADVAGKGMPAAILMAATRAMMRSFVKVQDSPSETLMQLNQTLVQDFPPNKFVTMIYGVLDGDSREITLASAGHPRPMLINGTCSFLSLDMGLPLGLRASSYPEHKVKLERGSHLLLYTDGITEAMDHQDEEYGPGRLVEHFLKPEACVDGLMEEVQRFTGGSQRTDDATAVLISSR
ncbi:MAG: PP2C family protein-serine/threonine phosphatase [Bryobacteraceae bacterium]